MSVETSRHIAPAVLTVALIVSGCASSRNTKFFLDAVSSGQTDLMKRYMAKGVDVNSRSRRELTALHLAAGAGHLEAVESLLSNGAEIDAQSVSGQTPLHVAARRGHARIVDYLLSKGADAKAGAPIYLAAKGESVESVRLLIEAGSNVNQRSPTSGLAPAHVAAALGNAEILALLFKAGADPLAMGHIRDMEVTPLHIAQSHSERRRALLRVFQTCTEVDIPDVPPAAAAEPSDAAEPDAVRHVESHGTEEHAAPMADTGDILVDIDVGTARKAAAEALRKRRRDIDLDDYDPSYVICLTHPDTHPFVSVVVEWIGKRPKEMDRGGRREMDRVRVPKVSVRLSATGQLVEIKKTDVWMYRDL